MYRSSCLNSSPPAGGTTCSTINGRSSSRARSSSSRTPSSRASRFIFGTRELFWTQCFRKFGDESVKGVRAFNASPTDGHREAAIAGRGRSRGTRAVKASRRGCTKTGAKRVDRGGLVATARTEALAGARLFSARMSQPVGPPRERQSSERSPDAGPPRLRLTAVQPRAYKREVLSLFSGGAPCVPVVLD